MLKLVKQTSYENYPITPQTSAVRKLTVKGSSSSVVDMGASYLIIKNGLTTTINGDQVVRNVGFGCAFGQDKIWEYPSSVQIRNASLKIGGQMIEYVEDVNVRVVNQVVFEKNHEQLRREANIGGYTFQRLERGPKSVSPAVAGENVRAQGEYLSAFLDESLDAATSLIKQGAAYKEVACIVPLKEIFKFCEAPQAAECFVGGTPTGEIVVELQFEDRNQILCEYVNYCTDLETDPAIPRPKAQETLAITAASVANGDGVQPPTVGADLTKVFRCNTANSYQHVSQVPLYVGQPICLWLAGALPAVVGSNYAKITQLSVPAGGGVCTISFKAYTNSAGDGVRTAANEITPAEFFANIYAAGAGVLTAISGVADPILAAGVDTVYTNKDAGLLSTYQVNGLELVMVEKPMAKGAKQTIQFVQYQRDTDTIPQGQLTYAKSFMLDPMCGGVFCMFPPKRDAALAQTNLLSLSNHTGVTEGLVYRNLIDNQQLYSRDVAFSQATNAVEPLYLERLNLTAMGIGMGIKNLSPVGHFMAKDGVCGHAVIAEPVALKPQPQQLNLRMTFDTNATDRTIYVFKALMKQVVV